MRTVTYERPLGAAGQENYPSYGLGGLDGTTSFYTEEERKSGTLTISALGAGESAAEADFNWTGMSADEAASQLRNVPSDATTHAVVDAEILKDLGLRLIEGLEGDSLEDISAPVGITIHFGTWRGAIYKVEVQTL